MAIDTQKIFISCLVANIVFAAACFADMPASQESEGLWTARVLKSDRGRDPVSQQSIDELSPWSAAVIGKIKRQPNFAALDEKASKSLEKRTTVCTFALTPADEVTDLVLTRSCGDPIFDQMALDIVKNSSPFEHPPNLLPEKGGLYFEFYQDNGQLEICARPRLQIGIFPLSNTTFVRDLRMRN